MGALETMDETGFKLVDVGSSFSEQQPLEVRIKVKSVDVLPNHVESADIECGKIEVPLPAFLVSDEEVRTFAILNLIPSRLLGVHIHVGERDHVTTGFDHAQTQR